MQYWLMDNSKHGLTFMKQRYQSAERHRAAHKTFCAVNRVEHPDIFGIGIVVPELLADNAMLGKFLHYERPEQFFGLFIGNSYRGFVAFYVHGNVRPEIVLNNFTAFSGGISGKFCKFRLHIIRSLRITFLLVSIY